MTRSRILVCAAVLALLPTLLYAAQAGGARTLSQLRSRTSSGHTLVVAAQLLPSGIDQDLDYSQQDQVFKNAINSRLVDFPETTLSSGVTVPDTAKIYDVVPGLASSWALSNGGRTLTVHLRHGVYSHYGNQLTAYDVQYSWNRGWAVDGTTAFYGKFTLGLTKPSWRVVNKYTWQLTTPKPNAVLLLVLANNDLGILDAVEMKKHETKSDPWGEKWLATHDAGFGPYHVTKWLPGNEIVLTASPYYFGSKPYYTTIIYKQVPNASERAALVASGSAGVAEDVDYADLASLKSNPAVKVWSVPGNSTLVLDMQETIIPFGNVDFRRALEYATPVNELLTSVFRGFGSALDGVLVSDYPNFDKAAWPYAYNVSKAKSELAASGVKLPVSITLTYDAGDITDQDIGAILRTAYAKIGVNLTLDGVPDAVYFTDSVQDKYSFWVEQTSTNIPDPGYAIGLLYPCGGTYDYGHYCNTTVDSLLAKGYTTPNGAARVAVYDQIQRTIDAAAPKVFIANAGFQLVTSSSITGVAWDPSNVEELATLKAK